jgi:hypothetical protein
MVYFLGRWIRHGDWYPDAKLRLFRREKGRCEGREPHDRTNVDGPVRRLKNPLYHYTYVDIADQIATLNRFTTITAESQFHDGRGFHYTDVVFRPLHRFFHCYVLKRGFLDGLAGLLIATTVSYAVFAKYAKLWELRLQKKSGASQV